ncbi:MAG: hypothetical protein WCD16_06810 [Paracoccaceae bacterium]
MVDPNLRDFHGRLRRVNRIHRRGGGFEAAGTLGRSVYVERPAQRSLLRPLMLVLAFGLVLKAVLYIQIGPDDYQNRVERLRQGSQVEAIGAYVMQADAATVWLAGFLADVFKRPV